MLANDITFENISDLIEDFDIRKVIYPKQCQPNNITEQECLIYKRRGESKVPEWASRLYKTTGIDIKENLLNTVSQGASVLIPVSKNNKNYMFILNYSIGHFSIKKTAINKYFGIYIANKELVDGNAVIKRGKSREISTNPINKDRMFGQSIDDENFNLMLADNEVIREVTAYAKEQNFYHSMVGSYSSLNITLNFDVSDDKDYISLKQLRDSLIKLIDIYDSVQIADKKKLFKGLAPVDMDDEIKNKITTQLNNNLDNFFFFEPETDINLAQIDKFKINDLEYEDFDIKKFAKDQNELTYELLENSYVRIYDDNGIELKRWKLLDCLYGEFADNGTIYFISHGDLFDINKDKYEDIVNKVKSVQDDNFTLSQSKIDEANLEIEKSEQRQDKKIRREYYYNMKLSEELGGELFDNADKHIVIYETQIEVCDVLLPADKVFIHSKIRRGPESLSHLFTQGIVSAEAYTNSNTRFVDAVNSKIVNTSVQLDKNYKNSTIRYIILSAKKFKNELPFFVKMYHNNIINYLESRGFVVKLSWENRIKI